MGQGLSSLQWTSQQSACPWDTEGYLKFFRRVVAGKRQSAKRWTRKRLASVFVSLCCSVAQSCPTLCDPVDCSTPGFPVLHQLPEFSQLTIPSNHLILCHPLRLLPLIFPSIRVFSGESALRIRWPKYWSFSFSISPSNEYSGLISFRIDWFAVQGLSRVFSNTTV